MFSINTKNIKRGSHLKTFTFIEHVDGIPIVQPSHGYRYEDTGHDILFQNFNNLFCIRKSVTVLTSFSTKYWKPATRRWFQ